jgi:GNAT superfamily N-acetyltransferase
MAFELTKSVIDDIIFSMEDQNSEFVFDAESACIVPLDSLDEDEVNELQENENVYPLPEWSSDDGFKIMEEFAESVRVPKIQRELQQVLANGRGVFRNFKNVLKLYPHIEKRFHAFKEAKMRSVVVDWYNSLRESWGLEKLNQDFDDYDDLIQQDFEFIPYNQTKDYDCILAEAKKIAEEIKEDFTGEAAKAIAHFWLRRFELESGDSKQLPFLGIVARTTAEDFAGLLLFSDCSSFAKKVVALTAIFVNQNFRGLGIARELFSRGISYLKSSGIQSIIIADSALPDFLEPLIARCGFEKKGSFYVLEKADI